MNSGCAAAHPLFLCTGSCLELLLAMHFRVIGQKELVKTAVVVENSTATAVISFLKEDIGWTKRVGKIA